MGGSMNMVVLIGHLGRDAELRYTPAGAAVATLNLATSKTWTDKSGHKQERTEWHRVVVWGKTAEALHQYLTKGKQVCVTGELTTRAWDDKDGHKRYTTEVRAERVTLLGARTDSSGRRRDEHVSDEEVAAGTETSAPLTDEDIPF